MIDEKHWLDSLPKNQNYFIKRTVFWSPAFQTSKTPSTNYKSRNQTDKFASITTSTPRGAGPCCLHNCSLPLYPRQCCSHALRIPAGEKRDQRVLTDAEDCISPSWLHFSRENRCTWKVLSYCKCIFWVCENMQVNESLQYRTSGLGMERNKMLNF